VLPIALADHCKIDDLVDDVLIIEVFPIRKAKGGTRHLESDVAVQICPDWHGSEGP
jgi:hypothetical protein